MPKSDQELFNIPAKQCLKVYPIIRNNSDRNWQAAELLAAQQYYGQAISLTIVSLEELIKCLVILLDGYGFLFRRTKGVHRFFKEHGIRHYTAAILLVIYLFGEDLVKTLEEFVKDPVKQAYWKAVSEDHARLNQLLERYLPVKLMQIKTELPFFIRMDQQRQLGFYCDHVDQFHSPDMVTADDYAYARQRIGKVLATGKQLITLFESNNSEFAEQREKMRKYFLDHQLYDRLSATFSNKTAALFENMDNWFGELLSGDLPPVNLPD